MATDPTQTESAQPQPAQADADRFENLALRYVDDGRIAIVTMSRPSKLNAMTVGLVQDLHDVFSRLHAENDVRAIVLTGEGRGFCAGLDLTGYGVLPGTEGLGRVPTGMRVQQHIATLATQMRSHSKPIIAAVNGPAAGGGLALALASDVRIAGT